jgi:hypothetical protein
MRPGDNEMYRFARRIAAVDILMTVEQGIHVWMVAWKIERLSHLTND